MESFIHVLTSSSSGNILVCSIRIGLVLLSRDLKKFDIPINCRVSLSSSHMNNVSFKSATDFGRFLFLIYFISFIHMSNVRANREIEDSGNCG